LRRLLSCFITSRPGGEQLLVFILQFYIKMVRFYAINARNSPIDFIGNVYTKDG
jgi:hypothetical protein